MQLISPSDSLSWTKVINLWSLWEDGNTSLFLPVSFCRAGSHRKRPRQVPRTSAGSSGCAVGQPRQRRAKPRQSTRACPVWPKCGLLTAAATKKTNLNGALKVLTRKEDMVSKSLLWENDRWLLLRYTWGRMKFFFSFCLHSTLSLWTPSLMICPNVHVREKVTYNQIANQ